MSDQPPGGLKSFSVNFGTGSATKTPDPTDEKGTFRIVVLAELSARAEVSTNAPPKAEVVPVDKYLLDGAMAAIAPSLAIELPDPFAPNDPMLRIDLRFTDPKMLRPDAIAEQVPVLRSLIEARRIVQRVKDRQLSAPDARAHLTRILPRPSWAESLTSEVGDAPPRRAEPAAAPAQPTAAAAPPGGGGIDALFDQIDVAAPASAITNPGAAPEGGEIASLVKDFVKRARGADAPRPQAVVGNAIQKVDRAFAQLLSGLLRHPDVRSIERAWRMVKLLVDRCDFRAGVEVGVVPVELDGVDDAMQRLLERGGVEASHAPIDMVVIDHPLSATQADFARLERWSALAEQLRAPLLVNGDPDMLGFDSVAAMGRSERRIESIDDPRAVALRAVASLDSSRWLTIAINGVLGRAAYTAQTARLRDMTFAEDPTDPENHVFIGPAIVLAALAAASWVRNGWASEIRGPRHGALDNLPVRDIVEGNSTYAIPLEAMIGPDTQSAVARAGLTLLGCAPNHDAAIVMRAPALFRGPTAGAKTDAPATIELGDQLFAGRLSHVVEQLGAAIPAGTDPSAIVDVTRVTLAELFRAAGRGGPEISAKVDKQTNTLEVTIRPHGFATVSMDEVAMAVRLPS